MRQPPRRSLRRKRMPWTIAVAARRCLPRVHARGRTPLGARAPPASCGTLEHAQYDGRARARRCQLIVAGTLAVVPPGLRSDHVPAHLRTAVSGHHVIARVPRSARLRQGLAPAYRQQRGTIEDKREPRARAGSKSLVRRRVERAQCLRDGRLGAPPLRNERGTIQAHLDARSRPHSRPLRHRHGRRERPRWTSVKSTLRSASGVAHAMVSCSDRDIRALQWAAKSAAHTERRRCARCGNRARRIDYGHR